jgi:hypothetical protein
VIKFLPKFADKNYLAVVCTIFVFAGSTAYVIKYNIYKVTYILPFYPAETVL